MQNRLEQRYAIKVRVKLDENATDTHEKVSESVW
jgi:hypothetical protein